MHFFLFLLIYKHAAGVFVRALEEELYLFHFIGKDSDNRMLLLLKLNRLNVEEAIELNRLWFVITGYIVREDCFVPRNDGGGAKLMIIGLLDLRWEEIASGLAMTAIVLVHAYFGKRICAGR